MSAEERRFIERACESPFSFFVITEANAGRDMHLLDAFTGRTFRVLERSASDTVRAGRAPLYGMIASLDDAAILLGCAPLLIPPAWRNTLIDVRKQLSKRGPLTRADLFEYDLEIRDLYHEIADTLRHPAPPRLTNTDGDRLEPTTLEYGLRCSPGSAYERLKPLTMSEDDEELVADAEREPDGELRTVHLTWLKKGNRQHKTWDNTVLGTLQIEQSRPSASARRPGVAPSSARIVGGCKEGSRRSPRCAQCVMPYIR